MAEHDAPPTRAGDDDLAARIRTALDSRVEPVRIDEIELRRPHAVAGPGGENAAPVAAVAVLERPRRGPADVGVAAHARGRGRALVLAAAALVIVVIGASIAFLRTSDPELETVAPGPEPSGFATAAPGGIYDSAGGLLRDRSVESLASTGGRVYLSYLQSVTGDAAGLARGLLVADAADGRVVADHLLDATVTMSMTAVGDSVWFVGERTSGVTLWRVEGEAAPQPIDELPGSMLLATDGGTVWLRGAGHLQARDAETGDLIGDSESPSWDGTSRIAAAGGSAWTVDARTGEIVLLDRAGPRAVVRGPSSTRPQVLGAAGGAVVVQDGTLVERIDGATGATLDPTRILFALTATGTDRWGDQVWAVGEGGDPDRYTTVEILVVDGRTGRSAFSRQSIAGRSPLVAVVDERGAVVCVDVVATSTGSASFGSDCRQVRAPIDGEATAGDGWRITDPSTGSPGSTSTTSPTYWDDQSEAAHEATTTTTTSDASTPPGLALDRRGISVTGLAPIRLGMTPDELTAATGLATAPIEPRCGRNGREVVGLPDGVGVVFNGDDTVRAVTISTAAFSTADGLSVDSTIDELLALHPDAEVVDHHTAIQYIVPSPDGSSAIFVSSVDDDIVAIDVAQGTESFMDFC